MLHIPGLYIADSAGRGRGVFTAHELNKGDVIELCPIIVVPPSQLETLHQTILHDYYFLWPDPKGSACIVLGYGSIYNHHSSPNAKVVMHLSSQEIGIECIHSIEAGEEILIDYQGGDRKNLLWFQSV